MIKNSHPFRKKWGQNFLKDPNIIRKIVDLLELTPNDIVLEIGPGQGALTNEIAKVAKNIIAVEIDPLLIQYLESNKQENMNFILGDILDFDLNTLPSPIKIIGNLPYYITSPIIMKFLEWGRWQRLVFMTQKEVAHRIVAKPKNKIYGRLSVANVNLELNVPNTVFHPKPDVSSSILSFTPKNNEILDIEKFSHLVKLSFAQRRKKLKNNLKSIFTSEELGKLADSRAEELSVEDFVFLNNQLIIKNQ